MANETFETETLAALAVKIARYATEADEKTIEAAKLIREARKRVEAGEAGEVKWYEWGRKNIKLLITRLRECLGDPAKGPLVGGADVLSGDAQQLGCSVQGALQHARMYVELPR